MMLLLAAILMIGWLLGYGIYHTASAGIHLLLVLALIAVAIHFTRAATGRPTRRSP